MAVTSKRTEIIEFSGDVGATLAYASSENSASPGDIDIMSLILGNNTITLPTGGSTPRAVTIVPPTGNEETITLKGVNGDTGIALNKVDPTTVTFDSPPPVSFVLTAGAAIAGLRLVWS